MGPFVSGRWLRLTLARRQEELHDLLGPHVSPCAVIRGEEYYELDELASFLTTWQHEQLCERAMHALPSAPPPPEDSLAHARPDLAKQWHPERNGSLSPRDVAIDSPRVAWWKCESGHEWPDSVGYRTSASGCPYCAREASDQDSIEAVVPALVDQWHPTRNTLPPELVPACSPARYWWMCPRYDNHVWQASVQERIAMPDCPFCMGRTSANSLVSVPSSTLTPQKRRKRPSSPKK